MAQKFKMKKWSFIYCSTNYKFNTWCVYWSLPTIARYVSAFQMHAFYANHILLSPIWFKSSHSNHTIACIIWLFDNGSRTWSARIRDYHVLFLMNTSSNLIWELLNSRFGWTFKLLVYSVSRSFFCLFLNASPVKTTTSSYSVQKRSVSE